MPSSQGEQWLNAAKFPEIAFRTTRVEDLGNQAMRVHAELTMHGVTRPIVLDATYNGGYVGHPMDPHARIGFSAHGVLRRSEFGISGGIPQAGTNMGVGDQVAVAIESEFNGPPMAKAEARSRLPQAERNLNVTQCDSETKKERVVVESHGCRASLAQAQ